MHSDREDKLSKLVDLTGRTFGRLTVIKLAPKTDRRTRWICLCECGKTTTVVKDSLNIGTKSCGCLKGGVVIHGHAYAKRPTPEYKTWCGMKERCLNQNNPAYARYGGRGIEICDHWISSFQRFYADMGQKPSPKHSIERIDNDGPYSPDNCKWATQSEQCRNRRNSTIVQYEGKSFTLIGLAEYMGIHYKRLHSLYRYLGYSIEEAVERCLAKPTIPKG